MIRVAVLSCLATTNLRPHCLYCGNRGPEVKRLRDLGVRVIFHEPSLKDDLKKGYGSDYQQFAGHWLRADIPEIETKEEFILYTDIDVLFRGLPQQLSAPKLLAVAPEHRKGDWKKFNSGVMLMNLPALRREYPAFMDNIRTRLRGDFTYPAHDQASFIEFFGGRTDPLPISMNWKPYWGENPDAHIVHFHGPKPGLVRAMQSGKLQGREELRSIWQRNTEAYGAYIDLFERIATDGPETQSKTPTTSCQVVEGAPMRPSDLSALASRHITNTYYRAQEQWLTTRSWLKAHGLLKSRRQ